LTNGLEKGEAYRWKYKQQAHLHAESTGINCRAGSPGSSLVKVDAKPQEEDSPAVVEESQQVNAVQTF
jgi:hypothetical protein